MFVEFVDMKRHENVILCSIIMKHTKVVLPVTSANIKCTPQIGRFDSNDLRRIFAKSIHMHILVNVVVSVPLLVTLDQYCENTKELFIILKNRVVRG
jgi:hypothetical protein